MKGLDPVSILKQRGHFLENVSDVATMCNWTIKDTKELKDYVHTELIRIDNLLFDIYKDVQDPDIAYIVWDNEMEELRHWLGMILGVKIRYV